MELIYLIVAKRRVFERGRANETSAWNFTKDAIRNGTRQIAERKIREIRMGIEK